MLAGLRARQQGNLFLRALRSCQNNLSSAAATKSAVAQTSLYDFHISKGAKMTVFGGYKMPVDYQGIPTLDSVKNTRDTSTWFDVSHMGQVLLSGPSSTQLLERATVASPEKLKLGSACLSLLLNHSGGILDDCIITRTKTSEYFIVFNAGKTASDMQAVISAAEDLALTPKDSSLEWLQDRSLIAVQGPSAHRHAESISGLSLLKLPFMQRADFVLEGHKCWLTRCGYTGEDGFEISIPNSLAEQLAERLVTRNCHPSGLAARDVLRLEAGLCLSGVDFDETVSPAKATLLWTIDKQRRSEGRFVGHEFATKLSKQKRIGFIVNGTRPVRAGWTLFSHDGTAVGNVTSGTSSPHVGSPIGMAYVDKALAVPGTVLKAKNGKAELEVSVSKMPFVPSRYYKL